MPRQYTPRVVATCGHCEQPYTVRAYRAAETHYCSIRCKAIATTPPVVARLLNKSVRSSFGCLLWTGYVGPEGYGRLGVRGRSIGAHVAAYREWVGAIPGRHQVQHLCDANYAPGDITYRRCIEPTHLMAGTPKRNSEHMVEVGRSLKSMPEYWKQGSASGRAVLTEASVRDIRARYANGESTRTLAESFGVHVATVTQAISRLTWRHVD